MFKASLWEKQIMYKMIYGNYTGILKNSLENKEMYWLHYLYIGVNFQEKFEFDQLKFHFW